MGADAIGAAIFGASALCTACCKASTLSKIFSTLDIVCAKGGCYTTTASFNLSRGLILISTCSVA